ncbi:MAG TPA: response regulator transcription factor [Bacteroidales bacterium]|nr:response regulator transcription factor [Bacteroidales bacterium]
MITDNKESIRLIIIDDHQLSRDGIKALLSDIEFNATVEVAESGDEALLLFETQIFDVALVDINMPGMSGIQLTCEIKKNYPVTKVIALSMYDDHTYISKMIEAGASGYILKNINIEDLIEAINTVIKGNFYLSKDIQKVIDEHVAPANESYKTVKSNIIHLSYREQEILNLIAKEFTNEQIAQQLFISERTVETHRKNIFIKTKQKTIVGLIKYAIENKLLS